MIQNKCRTCALLNNSQVCRLHKIKRVPDKDFCSDFTSQLHICEICKNETLNPILAPDGDKWHILCEKCGSHLNVCTFCKNNKICDFETNPSSIPKYIQKKTPMGTVTVRNPARVAETCQKNCPCYNPNFECQKYFNCCNNISHIYKEMEKNK